MDARINQMDEMEVKGFWRCDNGHEKQTDDTIDSAALPKCEICGAPSKFMKRGLMSGQERYESDKDRKEAENTLAAKRQEIESKKSELEQQQAGANYFRGQAKSARQLADAIRNV